MLEICSGDILVYRMDGVDRVGKLNYYSTLMNKYVISVCNSIEQTPVAVVEEEYIKDRLNTFRIGDIVRFKKGLTIPLKRTNRIVTGITWDNIEHAVCIKTINRKDGVASIINQNAFILRRRKKNKSLRIIES